MSNNFFYMNGPRNFHVNRNPKHYSDAEIQNLLSTLRSLIEAPKNVDTLEHILTEMGPNDTPENPWFFDISKTTGMEFRDADGFVCVQRSKPEATRADGTTFTPTFNCRIRDLIVAELYDFINEWMQIAAQASLMSNRSIISRILTLSFMNNGQFFGLQEIKPLMDVSRFNNIWHCCRNIQKAVIQTKRRSLGLDTNSKKFTSTPWKKQGLKNRINAIAFDLKKIVDRL